MSEKYLIVGLGNPGHDYARTRHNVGFHVVDELARRYDFANFTAERKALTTDGLIHQRRVLLAKPQTYMNLSGEAVRALVDYYKIDMERLIVVHDDIDLALGTLRLRQNGRHGGHNGMRSILQHLGTRDFARVRFGIGRPPGKMQPRDYVLTQFSSDDAILAQQVTDVAANAIEVWLSAGLQQAMTQFNGDIQGPSSEPEPDPEVQLQVAERAHELNPHDPKPLEQMARLYRRLRRLDDAADSYLQLAEIHRSNGETGQMLTELERAARIRPVLIEVREALARTYEAEDNQKKAAREWLSLAEYHEKQDDMDSALAAVAEALRINPQHPRAFEMQQIFKKKLMM